MSPHAASRGCLVAGATVWTPDHEFHGWVRVRGGRIVAVGAGDAPRPEAGEAAVDASGLYLAPGFVDIHIHGAAGHDLMDGARALEAVSAFLATCGCTGYLPTTVTAPWDATLRAIAAFAAACDHPPPGARPLGIHLEGPYLNPARAGMQPVAHMRQPGMAGCEALLAAGRGRVRTMTLAPELPGALALVALLGSRDVVAAMAHSVATYRQAVEACAAGVSRVTHCFNAMPPLHHRAPGVVGAALDLDGLAVEAIADGVHVDPVVLRLLWRVKGWRRVALVTDAMAGAGAVEGDYRFGGQAVRVAGGQARLRDGTLAGSVLTMDAAVRVMVAAGIPAREAVGMATLVPAAAAGLRGVGRVAPGYAADLVALTPRWQVAWTMVEGTMVHRA